MRLSYDAFFAYTAPIQAQHWDSDFEQGCVNAIRILSIDAVQQVNSGRLGFSPIIQERFPKGEE